MTTETRQRDNFMTGRLYVWAGLFAFLSLMVLSGCSSSSDTRTTAKEATSGTYQIHAQILAPTDGSTIVFDLEGENDDVEFQATASGGTEPYDYTWKIDGPSYSNTATGESGTLTFWDTGEHVITLTVTDALGLTGSDQITIYIESAVNIIPVQAVITSPAGNIQIGVGQEIDFAGTAIGGAEPYTYYWSIPGGDTTTSTDESVDDVAFNAEGTYTVTFAVTDGQGNTDQDTVIVTVSQSASNLAIAITSPAITTFSVNDNVAFKSTASGGSTTYSSYAWTVTGPAATTPASATTQDANIQFTTAGTYVVTVTVRDSLGNTASDSMTLTIQ